MADEGGVEVPVQKTQGQQADVKAPEKALSRTNSDQGEIGGQSRLQEEEKQAQANQEQENPGDEVSAVGGMDVISQAVEEGLEPGGDPRKALKAIAGAVETIFPALLSGQELNQWMAAAESLARTDKKTYEGLQKYMRQIIEARQKEIGENPLENGIDALISSDNPYLRALGYDLKIDQINSVRMEDKAKKKLLKEIRKKRGEIMNDGDGSESPKPIKEGEMMGALYEFVAGERKDGVSLADVSDKFVELAGNEEARGEFIERVLASVDDSKKEAFGKLLNNLFESLNKANLDTLVKESKKKRKEKRIKLGASIVALITMLLMWRAFKSETAPQR